MKLSISVKKPVSKKKIKPNKDLSKREKKLLKAIVYDMEHDPEYRKCKSFMRENANNLVLFDESEGKYHNFKGKLSKRKLAKLGGKYENCKVMINCGKGVYKMLPFAVYKKLTKIKYMIIDLEITLHEDGEEEPCILEETQFKISSMGQLFSFLNNREGMHTTINTIYTANSGWYTILTVKETAVTLFKQNQVREIKLDKFIDKYLS